MMTLKRRLASLAEPRTDKSRRPALSELAKLISRDLGNVDSLTRNVHDRKRCVGD